jgi:hypothetical protein
LYRLSCEKNQIIVESCFLSCQASEKKEKFRGGDKRGSLLVRP